MMESLIVKDKGWAWIIVIGGFISHFLTCGFEKGYSFLYVEIMEKYNASATLSAGLGAPLSVFFCQIFGEQKVVMFGGIFTFSGLLISAFSFGLTLIYTPTLIICTAYFSKRRATALSLSLSGCGVASIIMPYIFQKLFYVYGYFGTMIILSSISLHYCVSGALFYKPTENIKSINQQTIGSLRCFNCSTFIFKNIRLMFNIKIASGIWVKLFLLSFSFNMMGSGPVTTLLVDYSLGNGLLISGSVQLLIIEGTVQFIVRILCGFIFDLVIIKPHRSILWTISILFSSIIIICIAFSSSLYSLSVLMFLRGIFLAIYISQQTVVITDLCEKEPESTNQTIAMMQIGKGIGVITGSLLSGLLKDITNDYRSAFLFLGLMQLIGFLIAFASIVREKEIHIFRYFNSMDRYNTSTNLVRSISDMTNCNTEIYNDFFNIKSNENEECAVIKYSSDIENNSRSN